MVELFANSEDPDQMPHSGLKDFSFEIAGPVITKFYIEPSVKGGIESLFKWSNGMVIAMLICCKYQN